MGDQHQTSGSGARAPWSWHVRASGEPPLGHFNLAPLGYCLSAIQVVIATDSF